jgi:hypothetical protein
VSGAPSSARVTVENLGLRPVTYANAPCRVPADIGIDVRPAFDPGREWTGRLGRFKAAALRAEGQNPASAGYVEQGVLEHAATNTILCPASFSTAQLDAAAILEMHATWDGQVAGAPAPTGAASVSASFGFMGYAGEVAPDAMATRPIVVKLATEVHGDGSRARLAPGLAIDAALADPEFSAVVLAAPEDTWVNPAIGVIEGNWWISLFRRKPGDPGGVLSATAIVDASGRVIGHRSE